jgi:2-polyprenyl-3-methyl-5-hydroxy-6-metoxy-1,4-benzoquinol methylase
MSGVRHFDAVADVYRRLPREIPDEYCALLMQSLRLGRRARLLELGCGIGEVAIELASQGSSIVALDASIEMLRAAQRKPGAGSVQWVNRPVEEYDFGSERYDAVFSYESFHLFPDPPDLVERISCAIVPGGRLGIGWRIASWEDEFKDHIVSTFERFGISLADWGYSTCHDFEAWIAATGTFGKLQRAEVNLASCDSVFLASIERTSHLDDADRRRLRAILLEGFEAGSVDGCLVGATSYGLKWAVRGPVYAGEEEA